MPPGNRGAAVTGLWAPVVSKAGDGLRSNPASCVLPVAGGGLPLSFATMQVLVSRGGGGGGGAIELH